jgi:hypothetical protein
MSEHTYDFGEFLDGLDVARQECHDQRDELTGDPGPACYTKQELTEMAAFAIEVLGSTRCFSCGVDVWDIGEDFYVHDELWRTYGVEGVLCIGCFEIRLGRKLMPADFPDGYIGEQIGCQPSERLRDRLGGPS